MFSKKLDEAIRYIVSVHPNHLLIILPYLEFAPGVLTGIVSLLLLKWRASMQLIVMGMMDISRESVKAESS